MNLREDSNYIIREAIFAVQPDTAVEKALLGMRFSSGELITVAVGKAAWSMAAAAKRILGDRMRRGVVITKYGHSMGAIEGLDIFEAGHPIPDGNSFTATEAALAVTKNLSPADMVLLLISGGGSALFESPLISARELQNLTEQLLKCGADIVEINTLRKRLSKVKGGRFAQHCAPARVFSIVLSDIVGDPLDMIASGPACPDSSTAQDALRIAQKYELELSPKVRRLLMNETSKCLDNVETVVTGSVKGLCLAAAKAAGERGYAPQILTDSLCGEAREVGAFLAAVGRYRQNEERSVAIIVGGETVVHLKGTGKGGRNQELALAAAEGIRGLKDTAIFSVGSDGTDGPTDAAGGYVDGETMALLERQGISIYETLENNDAYCALKACHGLIITGPTGTNVNDVAVLLIRR